MRIDSQTLFVLPEDTTALTGLAGSSVSSHGDRSNAVSTALTGLAGSSVSSDD